MSERIIHGPVKEWQPSPEDEATIEMLLASGDDLDRAYGEAYRTGCFVREFSGLDGDANKGVAAVGRMQILAELSFRAGKEVQAADLTLGDCMMVAMPGSGDTRAERVRDGIRQVLEVQDAEFNPNNSLELYHSFEEGGFKVETFLPYNSSQPQQWTVKVYRTGETELLEEVAIPMTHEPIFGVDIDDQATLEEAVELLMKRLTQSSN